MAQKIDDIMRWMLASVDLSAARAQECADCSDREGVEMWADVHWAALRGLEEYLEHRP